MIQLIDVCKMYQSKKGKSTKALDHISLKLDNKGMTFILGKSGSGKSTLLNILGGLDRCDQGEMIVLGKSTANFKSSDYDSYRNTYVGFIFQEFNILEDYDVYENVLLALQLQQKKPNMKEIDALLEKLGLLDLKLRKTNELSGGEKQRVAIARALIKNPKIILADEPTGNLDSKTSHQVMDLLKEISKEKLVVVISHDEESAKMYADRIIEIKDGTILRDSKEVHRMNLDGTYQKISSRLPFKDSFQLGFGSLKHKKVRLFFTILLMIFTLGFFSASDTLSHFDYSTAQAKYLTEHKEEFMQVKAQHVFVDSEGYKEFTPDLLKQEQVDTLKNAGYEGYEVYRFYQDSCYDDACDFYDAFGIPRPDSYSISGDQGMDIVVLDDVSKVFQEELIGRNAQDDHEVVITNYLANLMIQSGVTVKEKVIDTEFKQSYLFEPKSYEDILNTSYTFVMGDKEFKIVGILVYDYESEKHEDAYYKNVLGKIYVHPKFVSSTDSANRSFISNLDIVMMIDQTKNEAYVSHALLDHSVEYFDGTTWKKTDHLNPGEVLVNIRSIADYTYFEDENTYIQNHMGDYQELRKRFLANYVSTANIIGKPVDLHFYYDVYSEDYKGHVGDLKIIGVVADDMVCSSQSECISYTNNYYSASQFLEYSQREFELSSILLPMRTHQEFKKISDLYPYDSTLFASSTYSAQLFFEKEMFDGLKDIAFYVSLVFLCFAILLISNFMFTSIAYRKKEIGVLRALGARSVDVMKIFLWEATSISVISGTLASILLVLVSHYVNIFLMREMHILSTPFLVGVRQFVVIYILVFLVTFIASILPIYKTAKMKPIDAILNK